MKPAWRHIARSAFRQSNGHMKPVFLVRAPHWFAIVALLAGIQAGRTQTWIQWRSSVGGNDHYYALTPSATDWNAAQSLAVSWGGTLATITSSNEQNFINATFLTGKFEHLPLWIGLVDTAMLDGLSRTLRRAMEKIGFHPKITFCWMTGEPFAYNNWKPGEPNNSPPGEHYVAINWEYSDNPPRGLKGDWNDTPLNGTAGYGGKTDGPYFGLVERETGSSLPSKRGFTKSAVCFSLSAGLVAVLVFLLVRSKRHENSGAA
jgi:hypothetical protein